MSDTNRSSKYAAPMFVFPGLDGSAMEKAAEAYHAWFECVMTLNAETGKFLTKRLQSDAKLPVSFAQCHSPQDMMQTQMEFFKTLAEDYANQANRMSRIVSESFHLDEASEKKAWPSGDDARVVERRRAA